MTYTPKVNSLTYRSAAYRIGQADVERALSDLIARQGSGYSAHSASEAMPEACRKTSFEGWKRGQLEFARRIAQITAKHAARHRQKFCWKHHSVGLLRRLALVVMVATILSAQYI